MRETDVRELGWAGFARRGNSPAAVPSRRWLLPLKATQDNVKKEELYQFFSQNLMRMSSKLFQNALQYRNFSIALINIIENLFKDLV